MKSKILPGILLFTFVFFTTVNSYPADKKNEKSQKEKKAKEEKKDSIPNSGTVSELKFRSIGPAFTSGRIADLAVNPKNTSEWYVAVASGNLWKTINNGITFEPVFENYGAYSIGCVVIDPNNTNVVWTGTGERNSQRALGYGDGVYKSPDGGKSWKNMGLKDSRQIGSIRRRPVRHHGSIYFRARSRRPFVPARLPHAQDATGAHE